jgi:hypothetical protein
MDDMEDQDNEDGEFGSGWGKISDRRQEFSKKKKHLEGRRRALYYLHFSRVLRYRILTSDIHTTMAHTSLHGVRHIELLFVMVRCGKLLLLHQKRL